MHAEQPWWHRVRSDRQRTGTWRRRPVRPRLPGQKSTEPVRPRAVVLMLYAYRINPAKVDTNYLDTQLEVKLDPS